MARQSASLGKISSRSPDKVTYSDNAAGPNGLALAPPDYGIQSVDHQVVQAKLPSPGPASERDPALVSELKKDPGIGLGEKIPLTPELVQWLEAKTTSDNDTPEAASKPANAPENYATRRIKGTPFVWGPKDKRAVDVGDITQGYLGDCYLMALLAAIARVRPEFIEEMIQPNPDGISYTVTFHNGHVEQVFPDFPTFKNTGTPTYAKPGDKHAFLGRELWPMLIEKAWAQAKTKNAATKQVSPDYLAIEGGKAKTQEYSQAFTGKTVERLELPEDASEKVLYAKLLSHFVVNRLPVVFYSLGKKFKKKLEDTGVIKNHGYAVKEVSTANKTVDLYNPHGEDESVEHPKAKGMAFMRRYFRSVLFFGLAKLGGLQQKRSMQPTKEEALASEAVPEEILKGTGLDTLVTEFKQALKATSSPEEVRQIVSKYGWRLWKEAKARVQAGAGATAKSQDPRSDDRPLYWARLSMAAFLRQFAPAGYSLSPTERQHLLLMLEAITRGRAGIVFFEGEKKGHRKILISGFDPFGFQWGGSHRQANPSGAAAIALDGQKIKAGKLTGHVEGVVLPVRFADFDQGIVERTFRPYVKGKNRVDMIMTISQGGEQLPPGADKRSRLSGKVTKAFEFEQWAGRRRSANAPDNVGVVKGSPTKAVEGGSLGPGLEFLESSLPRQEIIRGLGRRETKLETELIYRHQGELKHPERGGVPAEHRKKAISIEGSGGGYLSNEIFYRTALLREEGDKDLPVGHLHVPYMEPPTGTAGSEKKHSRLRNLIIRTVRRIIALALPHLPEKEIGP